ncbi:hypothetical protein HMPREF2946_07260 [Actinomyces sp. HMSC062G12]|nr:hypothetical protein HMPREF2946_07260 [Actinomyces sp. HMSC062G12]
MSAEVGSGHIAIFPVMRGFKRAVANEVNGAASEGKSGFQRIFAGAGQGIGAKLGRETSAGFRAATASMGGEGLRKLQSDVSAAARALSSARLKQQDAAGRARIAETQLAEAQSRYASGSSQVVRAEERLASARRREAQEAERVADASARLRGAQQSLAALQSQAAAASARMSGALSGVRAGLSGAFSGLGRFRDGFLSSAAAASVFSGRMGTLGGQTRAALQPVVDLASRVAAPIRAMGSGIVQSFSGIAQKIAAPLAPVTSVVGRAFSGIKTAATSAFATIAPAVGPAMSAVAGAVGSGMSAASRAVVSGAQAMGSHIAGAARAAAGVMTAAFAAAAAAIGTHLGAAVSRVDTLNNFPRVMRNLGYASDDARASIQRMSDGIKGLPTSLNEIASTTQQLAPLTSSLGEATDLSLALNNALLAGGKGAGEASRAMTQYTQMLGKGKVDLQSWRSLQEVMPGQLGQIAQALLGPTANTMDLYDAMQKGTVSFDDFNKAILKLNDEGINGFASFSQQAKDATAGIQTAFTNVGTAITRNIANIIQAIGADKISGAINSIGGVIDSIGEKIVGLIQKFQSGDGFGAFGNALQAIIPAAGGLAGALLPLLSNIPIIGRAFMGLTGPIGIALGAFTGLVATSQPLQDALSNLGSALSTSFSGIMEAIGPSLATMGDALAGLADAIGGALADAFTALAPVIGQVAEQFAQLLSDALPQLVPIISQIGEVVQALLPVFSEIISAILPPLMQVISALLPVIIQLVQAVLPLIIPVIQQIAEVIAQISPFISELVNALLPPIMEIIQALIPVIVQVVDAIMQIISALLPLIPPLVQLISAILPPLISLFAAVITPVIELAGQIIGNLVPVITSLLGILGGLIDFVVGVFTGNWSQAWEGVKAIFSNAVNAIGALVTGTLRMFFVNIPSMIKGVFSGAGSWLVSAGRQIINGLLSGLKAMWGAVQGFFSSLTSMIPSWKGPAQRDARLLRPAGRLIMDGLEEGLQDRYMNVRSTLAGFTEDLAGIRPGAPPAALSSSAGSGVLSADVLAAAIVQALTGAGLTLEVRDVDNVLLGTMDTRAATALSTQASRRALYR